MLLMLNKLHQKPHLCSNAFMKNVLQYTFLYVCMVKTKQIQNKIRKNLCINARYVISVI